MVDHATALLMEPLLARGRAALRVYIESLPMEGRPLGGPRSVETSINILTFADFCSNPALCFYYVVRNRSPTHILCEDGRICAIFAKHTTTW